MTVEIKLLLDLEELERFLIAFTKTCIYNTNQCRNSLPSLNNVKSSFLAKSTI